MQGIFKIIPAKAGSLPFFAFIAVVFAEYFYYPRIDVLGAQVRSVDLFILCLIPILFFRIFVPRSFLGEAYRNKFMFVVLLIFLASVLFSIGGAYSRWVVLKEVLQLTEHLVLFVYTFYLFNSADLSKKIRMFLVAVVAISVLQSFFAYFQFFSGVGDTYFVVPVGATHFVNGMVRVSGTLGNFLSGYMVVGFMAAMALALVERRGAYFAAALLISGPILLAQVRSVWILGLPAVLVLLFSLRTYFSPKMFRSSIFVLFLSVIGVLTLVFKHGPQWLETLSSRGVTTVSLRVELWKSAIRMFASNPVFGVGAGNFCLLFNHERFATENTKKISPAFGLTGKFTAHNELLTTLAETGVVGLVGYLFFLYFLVRQATILVLSSHSDVYISKVLPAIGLFFLLSIPVADLPGGKLFWVFFGIISGAACQRGRSAKKCES